MTELAFMITPVIAFIAIYALAAFAFANTAKPARIKEQSQNVYSPYGDNR